MFDTSIYINRRKVLKESIDSGLVLFWGNDESPINFSSNSYPFRQHSSFLYFFGIDRPSLAALIDIDSGREVMFGDDLTIDDIVWSGNLPTLADECLRVGITEVLQMVKLYTILREGIASGRRIHFLPPYRPENRIKLLRFLNIRPDQFKSNASDELVKAVVAQREIKDSCEIAEMERAVNTTVDMHLYAMKNLRPGMKESEIASKVSQIAFERDMNLAFPMVATVRGEVLHSNTYKNIVRKGQLFLIDTGAETACNYASDLASTFPVSDKFTTQQRNIYQIVLNAYNESVQMLKPEIPFRDIHFNACRIIFDGLKEIGLTKGNTEEAIAEGAHALFFPYGLGHLIGLDVHDMEDLGDILVGYNGESKSSKFGLKSLRLAKPLKAGMTVTIEPGISFIPELIEFWESENKFESFINYSKVEKYIGFGGVRNEENYVITDNGYRRIGNAKPNTIEEIEDIRSS